MDLRKAFAGTVALTGGAATGKSTVLRFFEELGWKTASADAVAGELFDDVGFQKRLAEELGVGFPIDRAELREATFLDGGFRRRMNAVFHRPVLERLALRGAEIIEVPLLFETTISYWFSRSIVVVCDRADQEARLMERLGDLVLVRGIFSTQLSQNTKLALGDEEIRTSCPLDAVFTQAEQLSARLRE